MNEERSKHLLYQPLPSASVACFMHKTGIKGLLQESISGLPSSEFYSRTHDRTFLCNHILHVYLHYVDISKQNNHRVPQFIYASGVCHFGVYVSLKAQSPNIPRENANRMTTFVKLPSNTFSRVILWLALEVLAKRKHIGQPQSESLPPSQLPPNHSSV